MPETSVRALLWLFTINLGIVFGAGLYESRVVVPLWASAPPGSLRSPDSGRRFWAFVSTIPLTLLTLANLVAAWRAVGPERTWWLSATLVVLAERVATFAFFIPTMLRLQRDSTGSDLAVGHAFARWVRLNHLRNLLTLTAWLAALKTLSIGWVAQ
ncbi:MAG: hypothetical protein DMD66_06865 [Gemmatimonadetes bacterium]|nr:MAG: hypothetical protein DMD66_06865 [Gemmatimonadota bacterium]